MVNMKYGEGMWRDVMKVTIQTVTINIALREQLSKFIALKHMTHTGLEG